MRAVVVILLLVVSLSDVFAQFDEYEAQEIKKQKQSQRDTVRERRVLFGGEFNLAFGTINYVKLAPTLAYRVKPWLLPGVRTEFSYFYSKAANVKDFSYGAAMMLEIFPMRLIVLHAEYGTLNIYDPVLWKRIWTPTFFLGAGLSSRLGKGMVNYLVLFNANQNPFFAPIEYRIMFLL